MSIALDKLMGRQQRRLFFPLSFRLAMKLEQVSWDEMCADPGLATFTLRANQRLFKADAVVNWFDTYQEAEAAGARLARDELGVVSDPYSPPAKAPAPKTVASAPPIARAVEVARRLAVETKDDVSVVGCLTGGATLLARLYGHERQTALLASLARGSIAGEDKDLIEAACQISVAIVKAYCEAGVGALLFVEDLPRADIAHLKAFEPVANLAVYYGTARLLVCRGAVDQAAATAFSAAGFRGVVAPGTGYGVAGSIAIDAIADGAVRPTDAKSRLMMTEWEIPPSMTAESVIALQESLAR